MSLRQLRDLSARMGVGVKCDSVGVMSLPPSKYPANPRIYPWEATKKGCELVCESVGVLAFHRPKYPANPRIYPWEATYDPNPRIYSWEKTWDNT
jgi:hypothetical protein